MNSTGQAFRQFLEWREGEGFSAPFGQEEARRYLLSRYRSGKKWQTVNGDYSAMRKFYEHVLGQEWDVEHLPRPRKERSLPGILSTQEVERLISHGRTFKHQVFMVLLYGTGLRLSEALNLRIVDIDGQRQQLRIVKGKGAKGRYVSVPECLLEVLRNYYRAYRPQEYLFNGKYRGSRWPALWNSRREYSTGANRSAQHSLEQARQAAGIERNVSPHTLRHCYATHHLENGTNLVYLKEQLGHLPAWRRAGRQTFKNDSPIYPSMPVVPQTSSPPGCGHGNQLPAGGTIGELFRDYGEEYIQVYGANRRTIKLIRSIRVCRTPALGGKRITCQGCGQVRYQYLSPACAGAGCAVTANARSARG